MSDRYVVPKQTALDLMYENRQVWMRLAALRVDDAWRVVAAEFTAGPRPPGWGELTWRYESVCFVSRPVDGRDVVGWFAAGEAPVADLIVALPTLHDSIQCERRASKQSQTYQPLDWPATTYNFGRWPQSTNHPADPLISRGDAPSYQTYFKAATYFFNCELGSNVVDLDMHLRVQHCAARIVSVTVDSSELTVEVDGEGRDSVTVELASDVPGPAETLSSDTASKVTFPLTSPPVDAWVLLKRDGDWLDRRYLRSRYTRSVDPDVEYVVEPEAEVRSIVAQGETSTVEFKSRLPSGSDRKYRDGIAGTVAAFANERGGWLLLGVANNGVIEGLHHTGTQDEAEVMVANLIRDRVTPLPNFDLESHQIDDDWVIVVTVDEGPAPPYGVDPSNPRYYVRRGATTFPASAEVVRRLARSRPPQDQLSPFGRR